MVTKMQALTSCTFHIGHSDQPCNTFNRTHAAPQLFADPARFAVSVKHGKRPVIKITEVNAGDFHAASECNQH
jgi:hypothetical protein